MANLITKTVNRFRSFARTWFPLSKAPEGFFAPVRQGNAVWSSEIARTLSAWHAGIDRYKKTISSLPLPTYQRLSDGRRDKARNHPAYPILAERPNPSMDRIVFLELLVDRLFDEGDFFAIIQRKGTRDLLALYPVPNYAVENIYLDANWNKVYEIRDEEGLHTYYGNEIIHVFMNSRCGLRGTRLLNYAGESLGLHRSVLEASTAFYQNAPRPAGYIKLPGPADPKAKANLKEGFKDEYVGPKNSGKVPYLENGGEYIPFANTTAEDAQIAQALGSQVADVGRWFDLSPIQLGDYSAAHYNSLAADNVYLYQRSIRPILEKITTELNQKVFGLNSDYYCEFNVRSILEGSPEQEADVYAKATGGKAWLLPSEVRDFQNLPARPELDNPTPVQPVQQPPAQGNPNGSPLPK